VTATATRPPAPAPPHPRIRQRRIEVLRDQGRRRLRLLVATACVLGGLLVTYAVLHSPWLRVDRVEVSGLHRTPPAAVSAVARGQLHRPMIDAGGPALVAALERLPWVRAATVTRRWPSTLAIAVLERTPVAQAQVAGGWALVDGTGRVVAVSSSPTSGLPTLGTAPWRGRPGASLGPSAPVLLRALAAVPAGLRPGLAAVVPEDGGAVALVLAGGTTVDLGPPSDLGAKMAALSTLSAQTDLTKAAAVDLSLPDRPLVTPRSAGP